MGGQLRSSRGWGGSRGGVKVEGVGWLQGWWCSKVGGRDDVGYGG